MNTQHRCWITNKRHWWNADRRNPKYCASVPVTLCPPHTPRGLPWDRTRNFAVRGWRTNHPSHGSALFPSCQTQHPRDRERCDSQSSHLYRSLDRSLLASWQQMTLTFHRNQYYHALMLTSSQHRHCRLSCFCPPHLTGVTPYTHAIFVYFTFFFPNSSRYIGAAPRTNYLVLRHNHKPQRPSTYVWFSVGTALQSPGAYLPATRVSVPLSQGFPKPFCSRPSFAYENNHGSSHPCSQLIVCPDNRHPI